MAVFSRVSTSLVVMSLDDRHVPRSQHGFTVNTVLQLAVLAQNNAAFV